MRSSLGLATISIVVAAISTGCGLLKNKNIPVPAVIEEKGPAPVTQSFIPRQGVSLAQGWQLMSDLQTTESCVTYNAINVPLQHESLKMTRVLDKETATKALGLAPVQVFSTKQKKSTLTDFVMNSQLLALGTHVIGQAFVKDTAEVAVPLGQQSLSRELVNMVKVGEYDVRTTEKDDSPTLQLSSKYVSLLKQNPRAFYDACGDSFVSSVQHGAQATVLFGFDTKTASERDALVRSLAETPGSRLFSEGFTTVLNDYEVKEGVKFQYQGADGQGVPVKGQESSSLVTMLEGLSEQAAISPKPLVITLQRYDSLSNWPEDVVLPVNDDGLQKLAIDYVRLSSLHEAVSHIVDYPDAYVTNNSADRESVKDTRDQIKQRLAALNQLASKCMESLGYDCNLPGSNAVSDYDYRLGLPVPAGSFAEDVERQTLEGLITQHKEHKNRLAAQYVSRQGHGVNIARKRKYQGIRIANNVFNPQIERAERSLSALKEGAWGEQMIETKMNWWVSEIARERCKLGYVESCFTKEQEAGYRAQLSTVNIKTTVEKPAAAVMSSDSVTSALLKSLETAEIVEE